VRVYTDNHKFRGEDKELSELENLGGNCIKIDFSAAYQKIVFSLALKFLFSLSIISPLLYVTQKFFVK
jgi:hypothetical protein